MLKQEMDSLPIIPFESQELHMVDKFKYLGFIIIFNPSLKPEINNRIAKAVTEMSTFCARVYTKQTHCDHQDENVQSLCPEHILLTLVRKKAEQLLLTLLEMHSWDKMVRHRIQKKITKLAFHLFLLS